MPGLSAEIRNLVLTVDGPVGAQAIADIPAMTIPAGRMTVLCGPSGSGKSTLLYLLSGLLAPQRGEVIWAETDIARLSEPKRDRWRLANCGFIFQSFNLIDELSPVDNVLTPAWFAQSSVRALRKRAESLLACFEVPRGKDRVSVLSRGEQQRVAVARALLLDPKIIFADEPTASLDARTGHTVAETLLRLASNEGRTVIVASHDPAVIGNAHIKVQIDHGRIVEDRVVSV